MSHSVLFHGSVCFFPEGYVMKANPAGYVRSEDAVDFERVVEKRRPFEKLSRFHSVFLTADMELIDAAGGYTDAIYEVEPLTTPEASDLAWYSDAWSEFSCDPCDMNRVNQLIDLYWSGEPYSNPDNSNVEYRARAGRIIRMVEHEVDLADLQPIQRNDPELPFNC